MNLTIAENELAPLAKKPEAVSCYICHKGYGVNSLKFHIKACRKRFNDSELKKPVFDRKPIPEPPKDFQDLLKKLNSGEEITSEDLSKYKEKEGVQEETLGKELLRCDNCNRTFYPDRLSKHFKICSKEKPFMPLPKPAESDKIKYASSVNQSFLEPAALKNESMFDLRTSMDANSKPFIFGRREPAHKPKSVPCYICAKEFGTAGIKFHVKACKDKFEAKEAKKPEDQRKPVPSEPENWNEMIGKIKEGKQMSLDEIMYQKELNKLTQEAHVKCDFCHRKFPAEKLMAHGKLCTKEKPFKPLKIALPEIEFPTPPNSEVQGEGKENKAPEMKKSFHAEKNIKKKRQIPISPGPGTSQRSEKQTDLKKSLFDAKTDKRMSLQNPMMRTSLYVRGETACCKSCNRKFDARRIEDHQKICEKSKDLHDLRQKEMRFRVQPRWSLTVKKEDLEGLKALNDSKQHLRDLSPSRGGKRKDMIECPHCGKDFDRAEIKRKEEMKKMEMRKQNLKNKKELFKQILDKKDYKNIAQPMKSSKEGEMMKIEEQDVQKGMKKDVDIKDEPVNSDDKRDERINLSTDASINVSGSFDKGQLLHA
jgi:hypothetical protein